MKLVLVLLGLGLIACYDSGSNKSLANQDPDNEVLYQPLTNRNDMSPQNENVYNFVGEFLEEASSYYSNYDIKQMVETERKEQGDPNHKPHTAGMAQTEMADILSVMCLKNERYQNITLYGKDGIGYATSGMVTDTSSFLERPVDLNLGFLTPEILSDPRVYHYKQGGTMYEERIYPVYKMDGYYAIKKEEGGVLVGYLSYIVRQPNASSEISHDVK